VTRNRADDEVYDDFGTFLADVRRHALTGETSEKLQLLQTRAPSGMSVIVPSDGGFVVQKDFSAEILRRSYEMGEIMSRVRFIPISATANGLKMNAIAETSRAAGSRLGGVQTYWVGESGAGTPKKPKIRQLDLDLNKLIGLWYTTEELEADGAAMGAVAMQAFSEELTFEVEQAFFKGDGVGKPKGAAVAAAAVTVAKETGQTAATIVYENVVKMWARCWGRSRRNAIWMINQDAEPQLYSMNLVIGTAGVPVYMPAGGVSGTPYSTLFGRPVIPVEYTAALGTLNDIVLADWSQYLAIDKGAPSTASSMHVRFLNGENTFRMVYRVDGQLTWDAALTPNSAGDTLSPVVNLAARA
jgi:HK97 family phage major capsid protein